LGPARRILRALADMSGQATAPDGPGMGCEGGAAAARYCRHVAIIWPDDALDHA